MGNNNCNKIRRLKLMQVPNITKKDLTGQVLLFSKNMIKAQKQTETENNSQDGSILPNQNVNTENQNESPSNFTHPSGHRASSVRSSNTTVRVNSGNTAS